VLRESDGLLKGGCGEPIGSSGRGGAVPLCLGYMYFTALPWCLDVDILRVSLRNEQ
jgi:hypothetical protein